jgi:hypothetical protein
MSVYGIGRCGKRMVEQEEGAFNYLSPSIGKKPGK